MYNNFTKKKLIFVKCDIHIVTILRLTIVSQQKLLIWPLATPILLLAITKLLICILWPQKIDCDDVEDGI